MQHLEARSEAQDIATVREKTAVPAGALQRSAAVMTKPVPAKEGDRLSTASSAGRTQGADGAPVPNMKVLGERTPFAHGTPPKKQEFGVGKIVAVTGASGFIGSRVVELLRQQPRNKFAQVKAYGRRRGHPGLEVLRLDDAGAVNQALADCHAVIHCAFDFHDMAANLSMTRILGHACAAHGVRLVIFSTASVYEPFPVGEFDETASIEPVGVRYSDTKIAIEHEVLRLSEESGLDVAILQPTLVYGPHCRQWTDTPVRELLTGRVVLPDEGQGICNGVYVDDVCAAAIAAISADIPSGERFLISGPRPVTWSQFYLALQAVLGTGTVSFMPQLVSAASGTQGLHDPDASPLKAGVKRLAARLIGPDTRAKMKLALQRLRAMGREIVHVPLGAKLALFSSRGTAATEKACRCLGWEPRVDFDEGMARTKAYICSKFARQIAVARQRDGTRKRVYPAPSRPQEASHGRIP